MNDNTNQTIGGNLSSNKEGGYEPKVQIFLSKDKNWIYHVFSGVRVCRHVNFYKKLLGIEYTPVTQTEDEV